MRNLTFRTIDHLSKLINRLITPAPVCTLIFLNRLLLMAYSVEEPAAAGLGDNIIIYIGIKGE